MTARKAGNGTSTLASFFRRFFDTLWLHLCKHSVAKLTCLTRTYTHLLQRKRSYKYSEYSIVTVRDCYRETAGRKSSILVTEKGRSVSECELSAKVEDSEDSVESVQRFYYNNAVGVAVVRRSWTNWRLVRRKQRSSARGEVMVCSMLLRFRMCMAGQSGQAG